MQDYIMGLGVKLPEEFARLGTTESQFVTRVVVTKVPIEATLLAAWQRSSFGTCLRHQCHHHPHRRRLRPDVTNHTQTVSVGRNTSKSTSRFGTPPRTFAWCGNCDGTHPSRWPRLDFSRRLRWARPKKKKPCIRPGEWFNELPTTGRSRGWLFRDAPLLREPAVSLRTLL